MTLVEEPLRSEIARRVQEILDHHQPRAYRVTVNTDAIFEEDEWYHVVVTTPNDQRDRDFYDCVADSEEDLREDDEHHVYLLVPAMAD